jgi:3-methylfumaryl-CoA hydratase
MSQEAAVNQDVKSTPDGLEGGGSPVVREEVCTLAAVRRIAAMLDLEPADFATGQALPRGWHFVLLAAETRRSALRGDGFPGLGLPMPDLGLPRLMLGGRTVSFLQDIPVGASVSRSSALRSIARKHTASGPMAVVTLAHELRVAKQTDPAVIEMQTYLLLAPRQAGSTPPEPAPAPATLARTGPMKTVIPDQTLLFQYSALGFNSHRIHIDREHARLVEGFPDLVVNGGLATLLLTEFLRRDLGLKPVTLAVRHLAPLYCNRSVTLTADQTGERWRLKAMDDQQRLAVDMEVSVK